jgi:DNA-directed RNA polymerase specialized sigma subunit
MTETNPLTDFMYAQKERNVKKREETQQLWQTWHDSGRKPQHLEPLLNNFSGLIDVRTKEWKPPMIPKSAFEAEVTKHVIKAIESYKPDRGASLNTHVNVRVQKAKRYMVQQQNLARIPEAQAYMIGNIQRAQDQLEEDFGRPPTHAEIASHIGMPEKRVSTVIRAMRRDIPSSKWETEPEPQQVQREQEILPLLRFSLEPHEQKVFDHIYGYEGAPVIQSTNALAKRLGMSPSQVSRIKTSIISKYQAHI